MKKYFYSLVLLPMLTASCGGGGDTPVTPEPVVTYSVTVKGSDTVECGDLGGEIYYYTATTNKPKATNEYIWSIDKDDYATIDEDSGALTVIQPGTVKITATLKSDTTLKGSKDILIIDASKYEAITKEEYGNIYGSRHAQEPSYSYDTVTLDEKDKAYNVETSEEYKFTNVTFDPNGPFTYYEAQYKIEMNYDVDGVTKTYTVYGSTSWSHVSEYLDKLETEYGLELYFYISKDENKTLVIAGYDDEGLVYMHTCDKQCLIGTLIDYVADEAIPEKSVMAVCHFTYS